MTAHVFYLELQLLLCPLLGALSDALAICMTPFTAIVPCPYLEGKMLQEVCSAVGLVGLGAGARVYPDADGRGLSPRGVLGSNLRTGVN